MNGEKKVPLRTEVGHELKERGGENQERKRRGWKEDSRNRARLR